MTTPTPQSDQAEASPRTDALIRTHECLPKDRYLNALRYHAKSMEIELRAQHAELLALRADKQRLDWLQSQERAGRSFTMSGDVRIAIDAALNSPTQGAK